MNVMFDQIFQFIFIFVLLCLVSILIYIKCTAPIQKISNAALNLLKSNRLPKLPEYNLEELRNLTLMLNDVSRLKSELLNAEKKLEYLMINLDAMTHTKADFIRNIQHELRTPLNHILGSYDIIETAIYGPIQKEYLEYIDMIGISAKSLLTKINNIITIADYEAGNVKLNEEVVNLVDMINSILDSLKSKILEMNIDISFDINTNISKVFIDKEKFKIGLMNILNNCIKFNKKSGSIHIKMFLDQSGLNLEIEDSGIGISDEKIGTISTMFTTTEDILTKVRSGLGLGLAIANNIFDFHDIKTSIDSTMDVGTTVRIIIPNIRLRD